MLHLVRIIFYGKGIRGALRLYDVKLLYLLGNQQRVMHTNSKNFPTQN